MPKLEMKDIDSEDGRAAFLTGDDHALGYEGPDDLAGIRSMKRKSFENPSLKIPVRELEAP